MNQEDLDKKAQYYVYLHILVVTLLIIGGLNWGSIGMFNYDFVTNIFKSYNKYIFILVGLAAVYFGIHRDSYLSFLGWFVLPANILIPFESKGSNLKINVKPIEGATKVVYWAANPNEKNDVAIKTPELAYKDTQNLGVVDVIDGIATLSFKCPQQYKVFNGSKTLNKHIHYRSVLPNGWLSSVETVYVDC
jgi:uncharacterized membrane protein YuzA (DUF378 family)